MLRRSFLGLAGVGFTALITGCGWGGDDDEPDTEDIEPIEGDDGLDGAEGEEGDIPGDEPDPESGV